MAVRIKNVDQKVIDDTKVTCGYVVHYLSNEEGDATSKGNDSSTLILANNY